MSETTPAFPRVLVAGDLGEVHDPLLECLQAEGFQVVEAQDGQAVWNTIEQRLVDVAVLDLRLPPRDGLSVLREMHQRGIDIPLILFSDAAGVRPAIEAMKEGAADFLMKPFQAHDALQAIHSGLRRRGTWPELQAVHELEARLRQAQRLETVGRLTSAVAHDLNNQMTVMLGYSQILLHQPSVIGSFRENVEEIQRAAERATELTRQLLDFSRKQAPITQAIQVNAVIVGMERMLRVLAGEKIVLQTRLDPQLPPVNAVPGQLEQVIMNLVINARDAMPAGGTITIATAVTTIASELDGLREGVLLQVRDTGQGMDEATRSQVFEPFFTTKTEGQGTGLGLAIVREIVKLSGGRIDVESTPGSGTTFSLSIPKAVLPAAGPTGSAPTGRDRAGGCETVLLVEDDAKIREMLRTILQRDGYQVLEATNCTHALEIGLEHPGTLHLLVTDVIMPNMDGPELARRVQAQRPDLRILFISGYTVNILEQRGMPADEAVFLQKPFSPDRFSRKVREVLDAVPLPAAVNPRS